MPLDTELHKSAHKGDLRSVIEMVESGEIHVGEPGAQNRTALHRAAGANHVEIMRYLLDAGAEVNCLDKCLRTPLHWAAISGNLDASQLLLESGADLRCATVSGMTPLMAAVQQGCQSVVEAILKWVVSTGIDEPEGSGSSLGVPSAAELCLAIDEAGKNALTLAKEKKNKPIVKLLRPHTPRQRLSTLCGRQGEDKLGTASVHSGATADETTRTSGRNNEAGNGGGVGAKLAGGGQETGCGCWPLSRWTPFRMGWTLCPTWTGSRKASHRSGSPAAVISTGNKGTGALPRSPGFQVRGNQAGPGAGANDDSAEARSNHDLRRKDSGDGDLVPRLRRRRSAGKTGGPPSEEAAARLRRKSRAPTGGADGTDKDGPAHRGIGADGDGQEGGRGNAGVVNSSCPWGYSGPDRSGGGSKRGTVGSGTVGAPPATEPRRYTSGVKRPVGQSVAWGADDDTAKLSHAASLGTDISGASVSIPSLGVDARRDHAPATKDGANLSVRKKSFARPLCDPL